MFLQDLGFILFQEKDAILSLVGHSPLFMGAGTKISAKSQPYRPVLRLRQGLGRLLYYFLCKNCPFTQDNPWNVGKAD